jgi:hypothetical protein
MRATDIPLLLFAASLIGLLVIAADLFTPAVPWAEIVRVEPPTWRVRDVTGDRLNEIAEAAVKETNRVLYGLIGVIVVQLVALAWLIALNKRAADAAASVGWKPAKPRSTPAPESDRT